MTAPVLALAGCACAPTLRTPREAPPGRGRRLLVAGAIALALTTVPPYLSERYVNEAYSEWRSDLPRAYGDLDRAASLNPLSDSPPLAEGAIARAAGRPARSIDAFRRAAELKPAEWAGHYFLALLYSRSEPRLALDELRVARELNPLSERIAGLRRKIAP